MKEKFKIAIIVVMLASLISSFVFFFIGYYVVGFFVGGLFICLASIIGQYANMTSTLYVQKTDHDRKWK